MKKNIHPNIYLIKVSCSCGNIMNIHSVLIKDFNVDVCYKCHSFYTGKQKISNSKGRLDNFKKRFNKINFNLT